MGTRQFSFNRRPPLSIVHQALGLVSAQPSSSYIFTGRSGLVWKGRAQPTRASEHYQLRIAYTLGHYPETTVLAPKLQCRDEKPVPHLYKEGTLCLFNPNKDEWNSRQKLSETVLPWACLWLYFYEIWLATGEWKGGGDHPAR
jgi:hypothetical protein